MNACGEHIENRRGRAAEENLLGLCVEHLGNRCAHGIGVCPSARHIGDAEGVLIAVVDVLHHSILGVLADEAGGRGVQIGEALGDGELLLSYFFKLSHIALPKSFSL